MVNNAAIHIIGDIELTRMQQYSKVVDANILGAVRVSKAFLPMIRKSKGNFSQLQGEHLISFTPQQVAVFNAKYKQLQVV